MKSSTDGLKNYIQSVLMLEKNKYELESSIKKLENSTFHLDTVELHEIGKRGSFLPGIIGLAVWITIVICCFRSCSADTRVANTMYHGVGYFGMILWGFLGLVSIPAIIVLFAQKSKEMKQFDDWSTENVAISKANDIKTSNYNYANQLVNNSITEYRNALLSVEKTLNTYYSEDIIYPKYRNLTALLYIFEYFDSGRVTTLVEAYNFYEEEWRLDKIISNLDLIIQKLDIIISNQFDVLQSIKDSTKMIQETSDKLINKANEISKGQNKITQNLSSINENVEITKEAALIIEANQYYERNWNNMRGTYERLKRS